MTESEDRRHSLPHTAGQHFYPGRIKTPIAIIALKSESRARYGLRKRAASRLTRASTTGALDIGSYTMTSPTSATARGNLGHSPSKDAACLLHCCPRKQYVALPLTLGLSSNAY